MSPPELPGLNRPSMPSLPRWRRVQHWNRASALLQKKLTLPLHVFARLKRIQRPPPVVPTQQDHGTYLDTVTAPQPLLPVGPMVQGHLMTGEIRSVDLMLSLIPQMNEHEVPCYYGSHANNTTKGLRFGSRIFGKNPTCQPSTNLAELIVKQDPFQPDFFFST